MWNKDSNEDGQGLIGLRAAFHVKTADAFFRELAGVPALESRAARARPKGTYRGNRCGLYWFYVKRAAARPTRLGRTRAAPR